MAYDQTKRDEVCKYLRQGETRKDAQALAGIHHDTFYEWLDKETEFSEAVAKAEAEAAHERTQRVRAAGVRVVKKTIKLKDGTEEEVTTTEGDWKADAWWLERRRRDDYALKSVHGLDPTDEGTANAVNLLAALLEGTKAGVKPAKGSA